MPSAPTDVDRSAPVLAHHEIDIGAPLERVWGLHTDVAAWPEWQKEITEARIEGAFESGTSFDWTSYGFPVTSTIYDVEDRSRSFGAELPRASPAFTSGCSRKPPTEFTSRRTSRSPANLSKLTLPRCSQCSMIHWRPGSAI